MNTAHGDSGSGDMTTHYSVLVSVVEHMFVVKHDGEYCEVITNLIFLALLPTFRILH